MLQRAGGNGVGQGGRDDEGSEYHRQDHVRLPQGRTAHQTSETRLLHWFTELVSIMKPSTSTYTRTLSKSRIQFQLLANEQKRKSGLRLERTSFREVSLTYHARALGRRCL